MKKLLASVGLVAAVVFPGVLFGIADASAFAHDWPQFRGPDGQGHAAGQGLPLKWSETQNVAWKVPVAGRGWSSPAVTGKQIWLTTALDDGRHLRTIALRATDGSVLHDVEVFAKSDPGSIHSKNSHASPTPYIDGDRVYVHFGAHGTACLTTAGEIVWKTDVLHYNHQHGPGGSPVVWNDLVIVNCDGTDVQFVAALDKQTGDVRWKRDRQHISEARRTGKNIAPMAYSTPLLIEAAGRDQLVSAGSDHVAAYDPATGEEIWWAAYDGYSNIPRPVLGHGLVFVSSGYGAPTLYAIGVDGRGDVTGSKVAWTMKRGAPLSPSPLLVGDELYVISDAGILNCVDARTGKRHYQERLGGSFSASPILADGRIYLLDEDGTTTVVKPGHKFEKLATNRVDGRTLASLAVADGAIFLRTDSHLYRIER